MLISPKTTRPISIFFHEHVRNRYLGKTPKILSPKFCDVKMPEPKNKMLGTMVPRYTLKLLKSVPVTCSCEVEMEVKFPNPVDT